MWSQSDLLEPMDVIVEDGLHTFDASVSFLEASIQDLAPGGTYVVEDITRDSVDKWFDRIQNVYLERFPELAFAFVELPNPSNLNDNNLLVIRRPMRQGGTH